MLTSGKTFNRTDWREDVPEGVNPILERLREHEISGNDPEETVLTPLEEWVFWLSEDLQEVSRDPEHIEHATKVVFRLAAYRSMR